MNNKPSFFNELKRRNVTWMAGLRSDVGPNGGRSAFQGPAKTPIAGERTPCQGRFRENLKTAMTLGSRNELEELVD